MPSDPDTLLAAWLAAPGDPAARTALADACRHDPELTRRARALSALDGLLALRLRGMPAAGFRSALDARMDGFATADFRRGVLRALPSRRSAAIRWLAAAAVLAIATLLWWAPWNQAQAMAVIADAGQRRLPLPGGGEVEILPGSAWLPTPAGGRLQAGTADLSVAPRVGNPLRVELGDAGINVLGTVFRLRRHGAAGSILLQQGRLAVGRGADSWTMEAGDALDLSATSARRGRVLLAGWTAAAAPETMAVLVQPPATLTFSAPAGDPITWALAERPIDGLGTVTMLATGSGAPGTSWGLIASESDGDAWLLGGDKLAAIPTPVLRGWWPDVPPHKRLAGHGDGRFDPATVVRIGISISGGAGTLVLQEPVAWR